MAIIAVIVGILIIAKGVEPALPATFSGITFTVILALYWLRSEKEDEKADDHDK